MLDERGTVTWEMPWGGIHDLHRLANGNILTQRAMYEVVEIDPAKKQVVWSYDAATQNGNAGRRVEVHALQPLPGDRFLIAESGPVRLLEIDRAGTMHAMVPLTVNRPDPTATRASCASSTRATTSSATRATVACASTTRAVRSCGRSRYRSSSPRDRATAPRRSATRCSSPCGCPTATP
ncbi:MAG: hypothetical protein JNL12_20435 [Planctomycetes bacterium]|nr:hypothetical protein [Planctomycetota bacterium]